MDGMRNRQQPHPHHQQSFPRMPNWMSEHDAMNDLASRMTPPSWPLGRRSGPWRERRGSGGSAMSATSEDDSSYDAAANDKSSQGSGGSAGLESVTHEIPIMIEAEMPPSMMQQTANNQTQQQANTDAVNSSFQQTQAPTKRHSETNAPKLGGNDASGGQGRATRCASAPPQIVENPNMKQDSSAPQMRSATVPIHNNIAKPFDPSYGSTGSSVKQDPIMEEAVQPPQQYGDQPSNQNQPPQNQQQFAPDQQQYQPQHPQQQNSQQYYPQQQPYPPNQYPQQQYYQQDQPYEQNPQYQNYPPHQRQPRNFQQEYYPGRNPDQGYYQQPMYDNQYGAYPNYYPDAPVGFEDFTQQPQPQRGGQPQPKSSVIRNIPIFIEGQNDPIVNEDRPASLSSSPRTQPMMRPASSQRGHPQERMFHPEPQQHYQQQQYQPQQQPQQRRAPEAPVRSDQPQPKKSQEVPINIKVQHGGTPQPHPQVSACQTPPRQSSPAPPPPKLTPLQKIDQIRANNEEFLKKVDDFKGSKKDKEYLYLDEMLTRALISLDDIDPDGKDGVRQARKALIKDINSKISLLEKKASANEGEVKKEEPSTDKKESSQEPQCKQEPSDDAKKDSEAPKEPSPAKEEDPKPSNEGDNKDSNNSSNAEAPIPLPDK